MANILEAIQKNQDALLEEWLRGLKSGIRRSDLIDERELKAQAAEMLAAISDVPADTSLDNVNSAAWQPVKDLLGSLSASRAVQGFTPSETAIFVMSLKSPVFGMIRKEWASNAEQLFASISTADGFFDMLALHTTDSYIHGRDQVIRRQQEEMLELSTPWLLYGMELLRFR
jgi:rsbT co-antagonist protein RsbR